MTNLIVKIVLSVLVAFCIVLGAVFWLVRSLTDNRFRTFRDRKIPHVRRSVVVHFFTELLLKKYGYGERVLSLYKTFDKKKYIGFYASRSNQILIRDITMVKSVLIDDFSYFQDRTSYALSFTKKGKIWTDAFNLTAEDWKIMRHLLSAYLTSKPFLDRCFEHCNRASEELCANIERLAASDPEVDALRAVAEYAAGTTSLAVLGARVQRAAGPRTPGDVRFDRDYRWLRHIERRLRAPAATDDLVGFLGRYRGRRVTYDKSTASIVLDEQPAECPPSVRVTDEEIAAHAYVACVAGFEGSRSVIASALLELARRPRVQERIVEEIEECAERADDGDVSYGRLLEMEYLDAVLNEVMRLHPPVGTVARRCVRGYRFEGDRLWLASGDRVVVSVRALHTDPRYWSAPHNFNPDRFNPQDHRTQRHPCAFMPFGRGPRHCIGIRFAKLQYLTALFHLLRRFRVVATAADAAAGLRTTTTSEDWEQPTHCRIRFYRRDHAGGGGGEGSEVSTAAARRSSF